MIDEWLFSFGRPRPARGTLRLRGTISPEAASHGSAGVYAVVAGFGAVSKGSDEDLSDHDYIESTDYAATLSSAMNDFHKALTFRWREVITEQVVTSQYPCLSSIRRHVSPRPTPIWAYWSNEAIFHLRGSSDVCSFVNWVWDGQEGSLSSVTCDGKTTPDMGPMLPGQKDVPPYIKCGMGSVLQSVEDWAWGEREHVYDKLPLFDTHDLSVLEDAHDTFLKIGGQLGLEATAGSEPGVGGSFSPTGERELVGKVQDVSPERRKSQHWWAGWTGLAADRVKSGFFASVTPSMNNQAGIAGSLANLYAARAAIIEKGRNDALYWIQWATKSLRETQVITTNLIPGWKTVQGIGGAISIGGGWSPPGAAVGAGVTLVGFIGENLIPRGFKTEEYKYEMTEVVETLNNKIDELNSTLNGLELEYSNAVTRLQDTIFGIHSYNLELYDLTQNSADGDDDAEVKAGYTADVGDILMIGQACYEAGDLYQDLLPMIAQTFNADKHLADKDGAATLGDMWLLEARDMLEGFLKTTCGRYLVAGDQVKAAAESYAKTDTDQQATFNEIMEDWLAWDVGEYDRDFNPGEEAKETDRGDYDPFPSDHPSTGGSKPGDGDGEDYVTY